MCRFGVGCVCDTPTGNQCGPPSTSFSLAKRPYPSGVRLRSARYARLHSASPRRGKDERKKDNLQKENYTDDFIATHPNIKLIFIATDENALVEKIRAQHPTLQVVNSGAVTHHKELGREDNFAKGEHALLDCLLLSRCQYVLKCQSALSAFAKVLNPRLEAYRISANKLVRWNFGAPYFPDGYLPQLTSQDDGCKIILARLFDGDWTQNVVAAKKFTKPFRYVKRKGYMRRANQASQWDFPLWSLDGLHSRTDLKIDALRNRLGI